MVLSRKYVVGLEPSEHRIFTQPIQSAQSLPQATTGNTDCGGAIVIIRVVTFHSVVSRVKIGVFFPQVLMYEVVQPINDFSTGDTDICVLGVDGDIPGERARDDLDLCQTRVRCW